MSSATIDASLTAAPEALEATTTPDTLQFAAQPAADLTAVLGGTFGAPLPTRDEQATVNERNDSQAMHTAAR